MWSTSAIVVFALSVVGSVISLVGMSVALDAVNTAKDLSGEGFHRQVRAPFLVFGLASMLVPLGHLLKRTAIHVAALALMIGALEKAADYTVVFESLHTAFDASVGENGLLAGVVLGCVGTVVQIVGMVKRESREREAAWAAAKNNPLEVAIVLGTSFLLSLGSMVAAAAMDSKNVDKVVTFELSGLMVFALALAVGLPVLWFFNGDTRWKFTLVALMAVSTSSTFAYAVADGTTDISEKDTRHQFRAAMWLYGFAMLFGSLGLARFCAGRAVDDVDGEAAATPWYREKVVRLGVGSAVLVLFTIGTILTGTTLGKFTDMKKDDVFLPMLLFGIVAGLSHLVGILFDVRTGGKRDANGNTAGIGFQVAAVGYCFLSFLQLIAYVSLARSQGELVSDDKDDRDMVYGGVTMWGLGMLLLIVAQVRKVIRWASLPELEKHFFFLALGQCVLCLVSFLMLMAVRDDIHRDPAVADARFFFDQIEFGALLFLALHLFLILLDNGGETSVWRVTPIVMMLLLFEDLTGFAVKAQDEYGKTPRGVFVAACVVLMVMMSLSALVTTLAHMKPDDADQTGEHTSATTNATATTMEMGVQAEL